MRLDSAVLNTRLKPYNGLAEMNGKMASLSLSHYIKGMLATVIRILHCKLNATYDVILIVEIVLNNLTYLLE